MRGYFQKTFFLTSLLLTISISHAQEDSDNIWALATSGDIERLEELLLSDPKAVNYTDTLGNIPLHHASWNGHIQIMELLIDNKSKIDTKNNLNWTP